MVITRIYRIDKNKFILLLMSYETAVSDSDINFPGNIESVY